MRGDSPNIIANSLLSCRKHNADGEYIICGDRRITWKDITPRVFKLAQALVKMGIKKDDKVAFMFHNTLEFIEVSFAIQVAGAIPTPMNYRYVSREIEFQAEHSDAKVLFYDDIWAKTMESAIKNMSGVETFVCRGKTDLSNVIDYEELINSYEDRDPAIKTHWDDVAVMIYTGGTTGLPKGVMLSYKAHLDMWSTLISQIAVRLLSKEMTKDRHKIMMEAAPIPGKGLLGPVLRTKAFRKFISRPSTANMIRKLFYKRLSDPDAARKNYKNVTKVMYPSMPFFHVSGFANLMLSALSGNFCYILFESVSFDPDTILTYVQQENVSGIANVPTGWKKLVSFKDFNKYDVSSVRVATTGGGPCASSLKKEMMRMFPNAMVVDTFGQTEMTPVTSFKLDVDADTITDRSVGKSIVKTKIVDDTGKEVPQGEVGEILYHSTTVMKGYYKDDQKTKEVISDGWFRSGDLGYIDENGEIRVMDRKKECINTGGEKVFPLEVEEAIQSHHKVDFACVIAVPDEEWGNMIRAVVQLKDNEEIDEKELSDYLRGSLAGYKIPRSMVFVDNLPISPAGKMLRQKVKDEWGQS